MTITILIVLRDTAEYQILTLFVISVFFQILLIIGRPIDNLLDHRFSIFNEIMVTLYLYLLLTLTDYAPLPNRELVGFALLGTIIMSAIINFMKFFYLVGCELLVMWRKRQMRKKWEEEQLKKREKAENTEEKKKLDIESGKKGDKN
jgi:hypothetical protein